MKTAKLFGIITALAIIVLGVAGCSLFGSFDVTLVIKNESSVTVEVEVAYSGGLEPWSGTLAPGASETRNGRYRNVAVEAYWQVIYTVNGKTASKSSYYGAGNQATCTITQDDVDNL